MAYQTRVNNGVIETQPLEPTEAFIGSEDGPLSSASIGDYWQWAFSDIVGNTERGVLAEYIVAKAVGALGQTRNDWAPYDLLSPSGIKVEVKSSAYLQSWFQRTPSRPQFSIRKAVEWSPELNEYIGEKRRHSDVYVFCLLAHQGDKQSLNPLDLSQWEFYVVPTMEIDKKYGERQSITVGQVRELSRSYTLPELAKAIES